MLLKVLLYARAGIRYGKRKPGVSRQLLHLKNNLSLFRRKFGGIGQKIQQYLAQAQLVAVKMLLADITQMNLENLLLCSDIGKRNHDNLPD